jgi:hypothetical protein
MVLPWSMGDDPWSCRGHRCALVAQAFRPAARDAVTVLTKRFNSCYTVPPVHDDKPKTALELAIERLRKRDAESGELDRPLTDAQKAAIADARSVHASKVAELEILHRSRMLTLFDPDVRQQTEDDYRRELLRLNEDVERKITKIRGAGD